jgi:hypothetical protein
MPWINEKWEGEGEFSFEGCPPGLRNLYLTGNQLTDFSFEGCPLGLQTLSLHGNQLKDFSFEGCPPGLQNLYLSFTQLTDFSFEGCPPGLQILDLRDNQLKDFSFVGCLPGLQYLDLNGNQLKDFSFVGCPPGLKELELYSNRLENVIGSPPVICNVYGLKLIPKSIDWSSFDDSNLECAICRQSEGTKVLKCHNTHIFHSECLETWFTSSKKRNCVMCMKVVE